MEHNAFTSQSNGIAESTKFGVNFDATMAYALMSGLAKDKISYPVREVGTNAYDANQEKPFDVKLPTVFDPSFIVRDYGAGLPHEAIMSLYTTFGGSGKRDSNEQVGGLGYGSKSPFAYLISKGEGAASFQVRSFHGGHVRTYVMALDTSGMPTCHAFPAAPSDEPTGLEVSFTVAANDIERFVGAARRIYWHFPVRPNVTPAFKEWDADVEKRDSGSGWAEYSVSAPFYGAHVRMGCVAYPIDFERLQRANWQWRHQRIVFDAPIGSLTFTTSREELGYDSKTIAQLQTLLDSFEEELFQKMQSEIDKKASYIEACTHLENSTAWSPSIEYLRKTRSFTFKGEILYTNFKGYYASGAFMIVADPNSIDKFAAFNRDSPKDTEWKIRATALNEVNSIVYSEKPLAILKMQQLNLEAPILWLRPKIASVNEMMRKLGLHDKTAVNLDDVKLPKREVVKSEKRPPNVKKVYYLNDQGNASDTDDCDISEGGVFVVLHYRPHCPRREFYIKSPYGSYHRGHTVNSMASFLNERGFAKINKIWVFTKDEVPNTDNWVMLGELYCQKLRENIDFNDLAIHKDHNSLSSDLQKWLRASKLDPKFTPKDVLDFVKEVTRVRTIPVKDERLNREFLEWEATPDEKKVGVLKAKLEAQLEALEKKYPLMSALASWGHYYYSFQNLNVKDEELKNLEHYFALLQNQKKAA